MTRRSAAIKRFNNSFRLMSDNTTTRLVNYSADESLDETDRAADELSDKTD